MDHQIANKWLVVWLSIKFVMSVYCGHCLYHCMIQAQFCSSFKHNDKQWPHKQHENHSTCVLVTYGQNEILPNDAESSKEKYIAQY
jgi:hypothetical protein